MLRLNIPEPVSTPVISQRTLAAEPDGSDPLVPRFVPALLFIIVPTDKVSRVNDELPLRATTEAVAEV